MRRPLVFKIFFSVCLSFIVVSYFVWLGDAILNQSPSRSTNVTAQVALAGAAAALRLGGETALQEELKTWPAIERQYLKVYPIADGVVPVHDPVHGMYSTVASDSKGQRYAVVFHVTRFNGYVSPPLPLDIGPHSLYSGLFGVFVFSGLLTLYLTVPISRIRAGFGRLAAGDLKVRLGPTWLKRRDEIADLAADFDKMAARLEELVASRDRLLADISHELRSPLTRLHLAIALARQSPELAMESLQRVGREADKLEDMVGQLLSLSKLESGATTTDEYFFVSEVAGIVVEDARFEAREKGVEIEFLANSGRGGREALVVGSGKLVSRAIENVVRNALRFSRRGDVITIEIESGKGGTTLFIKDQGPGVKEDELDVLFEPFVQVGTENGQGYGLGLAITKRAIIAHGGTIRASNGDGAGLTIAVWLPAAPDSEQNNEENRSVWDRSVSPLAQGGKV